MGKPGGSFGETLAETLGETIGECVGATKAMALHTHSETHSCVLKTSQKSEHALVLALSWLSQQARQMDGAVLFKKQKKTYTIAGAQTIEPAVVLTRCESISSTRLCNPSGVIRNAEMQ